MYFAHAGISLDIHRLFINQYLFNGNKSRLCGLTIVAFIRKYTTYAEKKELKNLRSQIATSSWGGIRYAPMAFTEQGVAMLSSILKSKVAIKINISIIRVFTKMRELFYTHKETLKKLKELQLKEIEQDEQIQIIFEVLRKLEHTKQEELNFKNRRRIGFKRQD